MSCLNITGLDEIGIIKKITEYFNLHKLSGEDILSVGQRPKLHDYEHYVPTVVKMFSVNNGEIEEEQITTICSDHLLITFREKEGNIFNGLKDRLNDYKGQIRAKNSDYLAYALLDSIVDCYFKAIE